MSQNKRCLTLTAMFAVGLCASAFGTETPIEKLTLGTNDWFSVTEGNPGESSRWTPQADYVWVGETDSKVVEFDTDLTGDGEPGLLYTVSAPASGTEGDIQTLVFELECSPVLTANLPASLSSAKAAFAVEKSGDPVVLKYVAWTGSAWVDLSGATPPAAGSAITLKVILDGRGTTGVNYIRYAVKVGYGEYTDLTYNESKDIARSVGNIGALAFRGSGSFKSIDGKQNPIQAEKIDVGGGKEVTVSESDMAALKGDIPGVGQSASTVAEYLALPDPAQDKQANQRTVAQNYELGLRVANDQGNGTYLKDNGQILMKGDATAASNSEIKLKLNAIPPQSGKVTYQLKGSDDNSSWTNVGGSQTDANALSIPLSGTMYRYYKVTATIAD